MSDESEEPSEDEEPPKKKGKGMLFGIIGAVVLGGGGFFATYSGMLGGSGEAAPVKEMAPTADELNIAFVPLERMTISLGPGAASSHLRFTATLEVDSYYENDVVTLTPRILDVFNTYLRAVEEQDLRAPSAMTKIRSQMLRRIQTVTGEGKVRDLLITEFVFN
jgi:flagellar FliL protein